MWPRSIWLLRRKSVRSDRRTQFLFSLFEYMQLYNYVFRKAQYKWFYFCNVWNTCKRKLWYFALAVLSIKAKNIFTHKKEVDKKIGRWRKKRACEPGAIKSWYFILTRREIKLGEMIFWSISPSLIQNSSIIKENVQTYEQTWRTDVTDPQCFVICIYENINKKIGLHIKLQWILKKKQSWGAFLLILVSNFCRCFAYQVVLRCKSFRI